MDCAAMESRLIDYLYGDLSGEETDRYEGHLEGCAACARMVSEMKGMQGVYREVMTEEPSPWVRQRVMAFAEEHAEEERRKGKGFFLWRLLARPLTASVLAGCVAVGIGITIYFGGSIAPQRKGAPEYAAEEERIGADAERTTTIPAELGPKEERRAAPSTVAKKKGTVDESHAVKTEGIKPVPLGGADRTVVASEEKTPREEPVHTAMERQPAAAIPASTSGAGKKGRTPSRHGEVARRQALPAAPMYHPPMEEMKGGGIAASAQRKDLFSALADKPSIEDIRREFDAANRLFGEEKYESAAGHFRHVIDMTPDPSMAAISKHRLAGSYYNIGNRQAAIDQLEGLLREYSDYPEMPDVLLLLAQSYEDLGHLEKSTAYYIRFLQRYPDRTELVEGRLERTRRQLEGAGGSR